LESGTQTLDISLITHVLINLIRNACPLTWAPYKMSGDACNIKALHQNMEIISSFIMFDFSFYKNNCQKMNRFFCFLKKCCLSFTTPKSVFTLLLFLENSGRFFLSVNIPLDASCVLLLQKIEQKINSCLNMQSLKSYPSTVHQVTHTKYLHTQNMQT
jgi:hypothetical protein